MSNYTEFFLNTRRSVAPLECLEISHPNFSKTYYVIRNAIGGATLTHEDGSTHDYEYYPCIIEKQGVSDDMDSSVKITFGDLGDVLSIETDLVLTANGFETKPTVKYRLYRSDVLSAPINGPFIYQLDAFAFNTDGTSFEAKAPSLNNTGTGEAYKQVRFIMLRAFL